MTAVLPSPLTPGAASPAPFGRVVTAMVTPFGADGAVDLDLAGRLASHLVDEGCDGLVLCGTTGESPTLSWDEQHQLFSAVKAAVGNRASLLAGTGSNCTAEAIEAIGQAAALGADGALVVVPYYNKPPQEGLEAHFRAVALAAPGLPIMLYNIPGRTGTSLSAGHHGPAPGSARTWSATRPPAAPPRRSANCGPFAAIGWRSTAVMTPSPCRCWPWVPWGW